VTLRGARGLSDEPRDTVYALHTGHRAYGQSPISEMAYRDGCDSFAIQTDRTWDTHSRTDRERRRRTAD